MPATYDADDVNKDAQLMRRQCQTASAAGNRRARARRILWNLADHNVQLIRCPPHSLTTEHWPHAWPRVWTVGPRLYKQFKANLPSSSLSILFHHRRCYFYYTQLTVVVIYSLICYYATLSLCEAALSIACRSVCLLPLFNSKKQ